MGIKAEISWKCKDRAGNRREVYARHIGSRWLFFARERRFERWERLDHPPLEDWLELLDGIQRRIRRRLLKPEEAERVRLNIKERYPEADI
jgi:hypothetical protein